MTSSTTGMHLRLHGTINNRPTTSLMLPTKLSAIDLDSISAAVQGITELTDSLGHLMGMISTDMKAMDQERIHWTEQIHQA